MRGISGSPCVTCGRCCRSYVVSLLGCDVWRISRGLRLSPELFVLAHDQPEPADDGFLLEPDGWPQGLALDKRGEFGPGQPCVFLVELGGGHACCGIYEHRPAVCRTYPMAIRQAVTRVRDDALCAPSAWSPEQVAAPGWMHELSAYRREWTEYATIVGRWNHGVLETKRRTTVPHYLEYLLNAYDEMAQGEAAGGTGNMMPLHHAAGATP
jgi:Fe-S-cluster containining protein